MLGRARVYKGEDDEKEHLCLFVKNVSVDIYDIFIDSGPLHGSVYETEVSFMELSCFDD